MANGGPSSGAALTPQPSMITEDSSTVTVSLFSSFDSSKTPDQEGGPCPKGGWFKGCVWGSGVGRIGARCNLKTDCFAEFICVGGKCVDNEVGSKAKT